MTERERELEIALLLMVYQYCQWDYDNKPPYMYHAFMSAGETAFSALGINNGDDPDKVWERIEALEKATPASPEIVSVSTTIYDEEETHYPCTVQILRNSVTGEESIGWWEGENDD